MFLFSPNILVYKPIKKKRNINYQKYIWINNKIYKYPAPEFKKPNNSINKIINKYVNNPLTIV